MLRTTRPLIVLIALAALAGAQERPQISIVNGTAEADYVEVLPDGSARLTGDVVLHAERLGPDAAVADVTAERVTVIFGPGEDGETTITKLFAAGDVDIRAYTVDADKGETRTVASTVDRVQYVAADDAVNFISEGDAPVVAHITIEIEPNAQNELEAPQRYQFDVTARERLIYRLSAPPEGFEAEFSE